MKLLNKKEEHQNFILRCDILLAFCSIKVNLNFEHVELKVVLFAGRFLHAKSDKILHLFDYYLFVVLLQVLLLLLSLLLLLLFLLFFCYSWCRRRYRKLHV